MEYSPALHMVPSESCFQLDGPSRATRASKYDLGQFVLGGHIVKIRRHYRGGRVIDQQATRFGSRTQCVFDQPARRADAGQQENRFATTIWSPDSPITTSQPEYRPCWFTPAAMIADNSLSAPTLPPCSRGASLKFQTCINCDLAVARAWGSAQVSRPTNLNASHSGKSLRTTRLIV